MLVGPALRRLAAVLTCALVAIVLVGLGGAAHAAPTSGRSSAGSVASGAPAQTGRPQHAVKVTTHHTAAADVDLLAVLPDVDRPHAAASVEVVPDDADARSGVDAIPVAGRSPPTS